MNTLPDHVKALIYEYDNTYHDIYDGVMDQLINTTIIKKRVCHKTYIADYIRINGMNQIVHNYLWGLGEGIALWGVRTRDRF